MSTEKVRKVEAAQRQLSTAIELWFNGGDSVSIHTLGYASYEICDAVSKARGRTDPLLLDADIIKEEHKKEWRDWIKRAPNFFKHGDRDPEGEIAFVADSNLVLLMFAMKALDCCGIQDIAGAALRNWVALNRPDLLSEAGRTFYLEGKDPEAIEQLTRLPKNEFFQAFCYVHQARA